MINSELQWFIGLLGDGTYRFITPDSLQSAETYIGKHGGCVFTHAGYLVFAASKSWWNWIEGKYQKQYEQLPIGERPPHIDVPNLECSFSPDALKWLEDNDTALKELGGKYYDFIPKH